MISYNSLFCLCTETWLQGCNDKQLRPCFYFTDISVLIINSWYKKMINELNRIIKCLNRILLQRFQVLMNKKNNVNLFLHNVIIFSKSLLHDEKIFVCIFLLLLLFFIQKPLVQLKLHTLCNYTFSVSHNILSSPFLMFKKLELC